VPLLQRFDDDAEQGMVKAVRQRMAMNDLD
jgi:hypothetical protein